MYLTARLLPPLLLAFLVGVFGASFISIPTWVLWLSALFAASCLCAYLIRRRLILIFLAVIFLGLSLGCARFILWRDAGADPFVDAAVGTQVTISGTVIDEPDIRENNTHLTVALKQILNGSPRDVSGVVLVFVPRYPEFNYGDVLTLKGKLEYPKAFAEADGRIFDYPTYLRTKDIRYQMRYPKIETISRGQGNTLTSTLFNIKHTFIHAFGEVLPEPHNSLLGGLLLGGKQSLGAIWLMRFREAGIIHIIVLSGYNMTIVSEWLVVIFRSFGFYGSLSVGGVGIILFAMMTGGGATVMRAAVMSLLVLLARATGRTYAMGRALLIAAALMVLLNPSILAFDPSFQLSFLASLGLIFVSPILKRKITLFKTSPTWHEILISTLATQIVVLPVLLYQTGMLSLVALPVNLLVLPLIPLTMLLGFAAGMSALVFPFLPWLGFIVALPAHILLSWILDVAHIASLIPYASISLTFSAFWVFFLYAVITYWIWCENKIGYPQANTTDLFEEHKIDIAPAISGD